MFPKEKAWLLSFVLMVRSFQNHLKSNTQSVGIRSLIEQIQSIDGESRIVMEHTGRYYEPLVRDFES